MKKFFRIFLLLLIISASFLLVSCFGSYEVIFKDNDGTVLKVQTVKKNKSVTAPTNPSKEGHTFIRWDVEFDNIEKDLEVTAQYEVNEYQVT